MLNRKLPTISEKLIENDTVNKRLAIVLYNQATENAQKKTTTGSFPEYLLITAELEELLKPFISKLIVHKNYQTYNEIFLNWDLSTYKNINNGIACSIVRDIVLTLLKDFKSVPLANKYIEISDEYRNYLAAQISKSIANITDKETLLTIYGILVKKAVNEGRGQPPEDSSIADIQNAISCYLQNQSGRKELIAKLTDLLPETALQAVKKHGVITNGLDILRGSELNPATKVNSFYKRLKKDKNILTASRDTGFSKFIKGLGVVAATIFGFGVGGYVAYRELFCKTRGSKFVDNVDKIEKSFKKSA